MITCQGCEAMCTGAAVAHFLNCFLGACPSPAVGAPEAPARAPRSRGRRSKKAHHASPASPPPSPDWQNLTPKSLFAQIKQELKVRYRKGLDLFINHTIILLLLQKNCFIYL